MVTCRLWASLAIAFASPLSAQSSAVRAPIPGAPTGTIAFVDVSVVPMDTERVLRNQTVLVQDGWITGSGPNSDVPIPTGAVRVDGRGQYLLPGLADMHVHLWGTPRDTASLFFLLANGVTTVRNMFGSPPILELRTRAASGELLSPRIYTAGPPLNDAALANGMKSLAAQASLPYDFFKVYDAAGSDVFDSLVTTAQRLGRPIAGHIPKAVGLERALQAGYASIEHLGGYLKYVTGIQSKDPAVWQEALAQLDTARLRAIAVATQQAGVWHCPTLSAWEVMAMDSSELAARPGLGYQTSPPTMLETVFWQAVKNDRAWLPLDLAFKRRLIKPLHEAGVGLLLGTDGGSPAAIPGFSIHQELAALVRAGLTPYQALETGTRNVAVFNKTLDSTGTVAIGKRADLVLLRNNPLEDIRHTAEPAGVMIGGRWLSREELDHRLAMLK